MSYSELSASNSLASTAAVDDAGGFQWNGLSIDGPPFGLEKVFDHEPGGHHPVHLGEGQYRVIHKLGSGGSANVWLCRDMGSKVTTRYVALKILIAEASADDVPELRVNKLNNLRLDVDQVEGVKNICLPFVQFEINGPNGSHLCLVYPVLGPPVTSSILHEFENLDKMLRKLALDAVLAIDTLHSHGLCHGDFTPNNILLRVSGLDGLPEDEVIHVLGEPRQTRVLAQSGESPTETTAPKYLVHPIDWSSIDTRFVLNEASIIDFGESFEVLDPPEDLGIPMPYRSPELIFNKTAGYGSDLWTLSCTIFEIRTGRKLFNPYGDEPDDYLDEMVRLLGKLPEPWWSATWEIRREWYKDEADAHGRVVSTKEDVEEMKAEEEVLVKTNIHPSVAQNARSIQDKLAPGLWYMPDTRRDIHRSISVEEIESLTDLLRKLLEFDPKERLTARAALEHPWFNQI